MKSLMASASAVTLMAALASQSATAVETATKQELTALTTLAVATAAAGPVGFVLGAVGASWLVNEVGQSGELEATEVALASTRSELLLAQDELASTRSALGDTRSDLDEALREQAQFARLALEQLQLEMLFRTNDSQLTAAGEERLALLATFLKRNDGLTVRITGYADPRGHSEANMALSRARAERVANQLTVAGIASSRLTVLAHGESQSMAAIGDADAYALERRVHIALDQGEGQRRVAEVTLNGG